MLPQGPQKDEDLTWTEQEEAALVRKLDLRLIPYLTVLYIFSFLDRVNIGNARLANLEEDTNMTSAQFGWTISIFFVGYVLFELPSNLMLKIVSPAKWISFIMTVWGLLTITLGFCKSFYSILLVRLLLGIAEAGLFPGFVYLTGIWWKKQELATRSALYYSGSAIAGAFGGLLAYLFTFLSGYGGLAGWQWIFILEGIPTVIAAITVWFYFPDNPQSAYFLTPREKYIAYHRLEHSPPEDSKLEGVISCFKDWRIYVFMVNYFFGVSVLYSTAFFMPTIVRDLGFSSVNAQLAVAPIYIVGVFVAISVSLSSDRRKERAYHLVLTDLLTALGYVLLSKFESLGWRYFAVMIVSMSNHCRVPLMVAWLNSNFANDTKRSCAIALMVSFGNIGGVTGGQVFRKEDAPYYKVGCLVNAICISLGALMCAWMKVNYFEENHRRSKLTQQQVEEEIIERGAGKPQSMGDLHPHYVYYL